MELSPELLNEPGKELFFARVADSLLESGNREEALRICEQGLKKYPRYIPGHLVLARCYEESGQVDNARAELERVLHYDASNLNALERLTQHYKNQGMMEKYHSCLLQLFAANPIDPDVLEEASGLGLIDLWREVPAPVFAASPEPASDFLGAEEADVIIDEPLEPEIDVFSFTTEAAQEEEPVVVDEPLRENNEFDLEAEDAFDDHDHELADEIDANRPEDEEDENVVSERIESEEELEKNAEPHKKSAELDINLFDMERQRRAEEKEIEKIDLSQFENRDDDFTTIMQGIFEESNGEDTDDENEDDLKQFAGGDEIEQELLAEEKPVDEATVPGMAATSESGPDSQRVLDETREFSAVDLLTGADEGEPEEVEDIPAPEDEIDIEFRNESEHEPEPEPGMDITPEVEVEPETVAEIEVTPEPEPEQVTEAVAVPEPVAEPTSDLNPFGIEQMAPPEVTEEEEVSVIGQKPKIISQTLGEILVAQKKYREAREVFVALKEKQPENTKIDQKIKLLDKIITLESK